MKFSIGDIVYLKRTGEEGRITNIVGNNMLEVDVRGITFPVYADEVEHPYLRWFTEKRQEQKKKSTPENLPVERAEQRVQRLAQGVYLSFLPVYKAEMMEDIVDHVKLYLLNELPIVVQFDYEVRSAAGAILFHHSGTLQPFQHLHLHHLSLEEASAQPRYHWQLWGEATGTGQRMHLKDTLRIRAAKLFEQLHRALQEAKPTFAYRLAEDFVPTAPQAGKKAKAEKIDIPESMPTPASPLISIGTATDVLDLHAEELEGYHPDMSAGEIQDMQLRQAERFIEQAIVHQLLRIVIIHGLGKGVLREEIHALLAANPEVERYANEWEPQYGFGATVVWLRR